MRKFSPNILSDHLLPNYSPSLLALPLLFHLLDA